MQTRSIVAAFITLIAAASTSVAQWAVTNLNPVSATHSIAYAASGSQQAGSAAVDGVQRASLWSGSAASWVDLAPAGATQSFAVAAGGGQQAGWVVLGEVQRASLWSGTASSWVDLTPAGATWSIAYAVSDGQQAGVSQLGGVYRASLWSGTAGSWVDLTPAHATQSVAVAANGGQQAGYAILGGMDRASLWSGTAASWVDLSPAGSTQSKAWAVSSGQQAGDATMEGVRHASLWSGSASSWVDLHPAGATESSALAASGGLQAGTVVMGGVVRASLWSGTAASWVDLSAYLPPGFTFSEARGIFSDGVNTYVSGYGINSITGQVEALLWTRLTCLTPTVISQPTSQSPAPGSFALFEVEIAASGTVTYQWRRGEVNLTDGGRIAGSTSPMLSISNVQPLDQGAYDCVVVDACNSLRSNAVQLSCKAAISPQPIGGTFTAGRQIVLSTSHAPAGSVTYRWKKDGANLFNAGTYSGVTTPTLTINTTDPSQSGSYALSVTNVCGVAVSNAALVEVVCGADLDNGSGTGTPDGGIDIIDLLYFLGAFEAGTSAADLDNGTGNGIPDGGVDVSDLLCFLARFEAGC